LALVFISQTLLYAQEIQVSIMNGLRSLTFANILTLDQNQNILGESNNDGLVQLKAQELDVLTFRLYGFEILEQSK